ncbi:hypothetical protein SI65_01104 [Aspergillus cristatus]|uniref:Uncharacterized protein n=1 Tax=Aspergillus cristatus TaxID=573508 RepID=A0A1E3BRD7_ASPCR|nr:hypothetical protein SI65_01104 [Aspergillus cristatus]
MRFKEHAEALPLSHHCFVAPVPHRDDYESSAQYCRACDVWNDFVAVENKLDSSDNRLDYVIAGDSLRDIVQRLDPPKTKPESFPLCHPDLSVNNIYVDDSYNITCIIDWEFASTVPEAMLLIPPGLLQSRDELSQDLIAAFRDGLSAAISSRTRTAKCNTSLGSPQQSRCFWLLTRLLNLDSEHDFNLFTPVWDFIHGYEKDMRQYFNDQRSSPHYRQRYKEMRPEDEPLETQRKERDYLRHQDMYG